MIAEAAQVSSFCRINEDAFTERHEVEVFDAFIVILGRSSAEGWFANHLANVLVYKGVRREEGIGSETVAFLFRADD